ncbi:MAG TPA: tetratricopeptide repeat protein, partial [Gemmatimonadales bacterium]|nr:tetratricopeptide repeat protein [Gemmatimonadales bacterium]
MKPFAVLFILVAAPLSAQAPEYLTYKSQRDTGAVARAESALVKDPKNVALIGRLAAAQVAIRQYREAIATYTKGLALAPNDTAFYRERGHRYLSIREFDKAYADLTKGLSLDSTDYGCLYHLGIIQFLRGNFEVAVRTFTRALPFAPDSSERAGSTDWLWMSLSRAGHSTEAQALLDRHPDSLHTSIIYTRRLRVYRAQVSPDSAFTPADTDDISVATLSYGIGDWYLVKGDTTKASQWFRRVVASGGWPAFGFIVAEVEL